jgi:hypothetical protein
MRNKSSVRVQYFVENRLWSAKGPRVHLEGARTLQSARRKVRNIVDEVYGEDTEVEGSLQMPQSVMDRIDRYRKWREKVQEERTKLRTELAAILEVLRNDLGASFDDSAELLGVDSASLMRTSHSTRRQKLPDDQSD